MDEKARRLFQEIGWDHQQAEHFLIFADEERKKYLEERSKYVSRGKNELYGADPTERAAVRGVAFDAASRRNRWLRAVEMLENAMDWEENAFLTARRKAARAKGRNMRGRPGWVLATQYAYFDTMEKKDQGRSLESHWLSESRVKRRWKKIVSDTVEIFLRLE